MKNDKEIFTLLDTKTYRDVTVIATVWGLQGQKRFSSDLLPPSGRASAYMRIFAKFISIT